jgi:hypothetical protein
MKTQFLKITGILMTVFSGYFLIKVVSGIYCKTAEVYLK